MDVSIVAAAVVAATPPTLAIWLKARTSNKKIDSVHQEIRTNHGMRAGEYLEEMAASQIILNNLLIKHTLADDERFAMVDQKLDRVLRGQTDAATISEGDHPNRAPA